ncbi:XK-related protein 6-like [Petromyzon marinus]|uniref:XK-related protein 6-like n=1 Tax=Petromyzon marinus TaxID=7757 RepID=UPI003F6E5FF5
MAAESWTGQQQGQQKKQQQQQQQQSQGQQWPVQQKKLVEGGQVLSRLQQQQQQQQQRKQHFQGQQWSAQQKLVEGGQVLSRLLQNQQQGQQQRAGSVSVSAEGRSSLAVCRCTDSLSCYCGWRSHCCRRCWERLGRCNVAAPDYAWVAGALAVLLWDVGTDVMLALSYLGRGERALFALTLAFVLGPSLAVQALSFRWFARDFGARGRAAVASASALSSSSVSATAVSAASATSALRPCCRAGVWAWQGLVHALQLGQAWRYVRVLYLGVQSQRRRPYRRRFQWALMYEYADVSILRLLESFLESGPQLVLQLSIMLQRHHVEPLQCVSSAASLLSLTMVLASYQKALRDSRDDKHRMSYRGALLQMSWRAFTIFSRVLSFALFASIFQLYFVIFLVVHWCIMTFWIITVETDFCMSKWEEILVDMLMGVIYIFCWFNVKEGKTHRRMFAFYLIVLTENSAMMLLWYFNRDPLATDAYALPLLCFSVISFSLGMAIMLVYYGFLHPGGRRFQGMPGSCCSAALNGMTIPQPPSPPHLVPRPPVSLSDAALRGSRELSEADGYTPVFEVRMSPIPPSPAMQYRPEGPVIRVDIPRKKYPAWDAHFIDRRLRGNIYVLEFLTPTATAIQYRDVTLSYEMYEYETTV